jgi:hypothetical protein
MEQRFGRLIYSYNLPRMARKGLSAGKKMPGERYRGDCDG